MTLPFKIYYTLKEASIFLNEHLKRSDIDENYFLQLGIKGDVCLGVFAKPDLLCGDTDTGVLYPDCFGFDFNESKIIDGIEAIHSTVLTLNEAGAILILNSGSVKDIYFNSILKLKDTYFNNAYSIDTQEFCVKGELEESFQCCKFFDKLEVLDFFDLVYYSRKHNAISAGYSRGCKSLSFPEIEDEDDWKIAYWFNQNFDANTDMNIFQSNREINKDNCLILGEDIELLLNGKKRVPIEKHPRKRLNQAHHLEQDLKLHPKREASINKVILALAEKASLDLNAPQTAFEKLKSFCDERNIEIPNKDTCGNLFKAANQLKNSN